MTEPFKALDNVACLSERDVREVRTFLEMEATRRARLAERDAANAAYDDAEKRARDAGNRLRYLSGTDRSVVVLVDGTLLRIERVGSQDDFQMGATVTVQRIETPE